MRLSDFSVPAIAFGLRCVGVLYPALLSQAHRHSGRIIAHKRDPLHESDNNRDKSCRIMAACRYD